MYKIIFSFFFIFFLLGCSEKKREPLTIAISPWPGYEPLALGVEKGMFVGLDIRIIRFSTPTESFRALRDGAVDVAAFTADEVLHYAQMENKPKMFLILDISNGGDAIVARKEIKTLDDLKGKRVCMEPSALGTYVIERAMDFTDGLKTSDFTLSSADVGNHLELYQQGLVDALVTYEPSRSLLLKEGAHLIFDSKQIPNEIVDVLVTEEETLQRKRNELELLSQGWFKTLDYIEKNKKEAMKKMASYEYISEEDFTKAYDELILPNLESNMKMLGVGKDSYQNSFKRLSQLMLEKGAISKEVNTLELVDKSIVNGKK